MARKTKQQPLRNKFIILTNGKRSEKNYLTIVVPNSKPQLKKSS